MSMTHPGEYRGAGVEAWDSLYISLVPMPTTALFAVLLSDCLYWAGPWAFWSRASEWLLGAALATGVLAAADGLIRYVSAGDTRPSRACWVLVAGNVLALLLSLSNLVYRLNEDAGRAVIPTGISLTAIALCLLCITVRLGREPVAVASDDDLDDAQLLDEIPSAEEVTPAPGPASDPPAGRSRPRPRPKAAPARRRSRAAGASGPGSSHGS